MSTGKNDDNIVYGDYDGRWDEFLHQHMLTIDASRLDPSHISDKTSIDYMDWFCQHSHVPVSNTIHDDDVHLHDPAPAPQSPPPTPWSISYANCWNTICRG